ncbi:MAG: hypothetical protein AABY11_04010, partial [archaeon]
DLKRLAQEYLDFKTADETASKKRGEEAEIFFAFMEHITRKNKGVNNIGLIDSHADVVYELREKIYKAKRKILDAKRASGKGRDEKLVEAASQKIREAVKTGKMEKTFFYQVSAALLPTGNSKTRILRQALENDPKIKRAISVLVEKIETESRKRAQQNRAKVDERYKQLKGKERIEETPYEVGSRRPGARRPGGRPPRAR